METARSTKDMGMKQDKKNEPAWKRYAPGLAHPFPSWLYGHPTLPGSGHAGGVEQGMKSTQNRQNEGCVMVMLR